MLNGLISKNKLKDKSPSSALKNNHCSRTIDCTFIENNNNTSLTNQIKSLKISQIRFFESLNYWFYYQG